MGYFSNGTEGDLYQAQYCDRCVNNDDPRGCAIWSAHLFWNTGDRRARDVLDHLIPRASNGENEECRLFRLK